ncbi:hypothetical protein BDB00DRAFT_112883 [Zychaea mexicana]|uniref:uncharacterized protein n=1 Tax=Zychaea mexicana TaxID=64656 RepID=UPI0022FF27E0|nr:uncharacterized protein BDB00DRAFT_112883 [Zychaea mexicana]KAI9484781.1 hypothetical protein BDB00DRAFT_112883 [Zychaea mexicana]
MSTCERMPVLALASKHTAKLPRSSCATTSNAAVLSYKAQRKSTMNPTLATMTALTINNRTKRDLSLVAFAMSIPNFMTCRQHTAVRLLACFMLAPQMIFGICRRNPYMSLTSVLVSGRPCWALMTILPHPYPLILNNNHRTNRINNHLNNSNNLLPLLLLSHRCLEW